MPSSCPRTLWRSCLLLALLFLSRQACPQGAESITYLTEDYPPSNFVEQGQLKGIAVELLHVLWKQMDVPPQPIQVINWARGYRRAETESNVLLFAMTRNQDREDKFLWVGPIYRGQYLVYTRRNALLKVSRINDLNQYTTGVVRADFGEQQLLSQGIKPDRLYPVSDVGVAVRMLQGKRLDFICIYADTLREYVAQQKINPNEFEPVLKVAENTMYYAFNRNTNPQLVARFQKALSASEKERQAIVRRYGGTP